MHRTAYILSFFEFACFHVEFDRTHSMGHSMAHSIEILYVFPHITKSAHFIVKTKFGAEEVYFKDCATVEHYVSFSCILFYLPKLLKIYVM